MKSLFLSFCVVGLFPSCVSNQNGNNNNAAETASITINQLTGKDLTITRDGKTITAKSFVIIAKRCDVSGCSLAVDNDIVIVDVGTTVKNAKFSLKKSAKYAFDAYYFSGTAPYKDIFLNKSVAFMAKNNGLILATLPYTPETTKCAMNPVLIDKSPMTVKITVCSVDVQGNPTGIVTEDDSAEVTTSISRGDTTTAAAAGSN